ncbi:aspartate/glutamate racemase family protein [uncultured Desulfovibrio sp.]|uniref:Aspartate/glutamate racemase family protein n=1 Tax=Candidatus Desulfovibrio intestinavium TaxID=2838534 RepID=A0A9D2HMI5_9BACT|nr:aspartate/glutamate racemase family protein [uncultured Desulfovibrio sp.]HJA79701.1 aspartate/glutamate racemase family protein [Candidatus Desulfovibrio intestinavium]
MILQGGKLYYDTPIGILCLDSQFPKPRGHLRNPRTYPFPTVQYLIRGVDVARLLFHPTPELIEPFLEGARELERQGVLAIAGSCGFMARFQARIAAEVRVPVLLSSLVQLPLLRLMHGEGAVIGVLTASARSLTQDHFANCMTDRQSVRIQGMEHNPEFSETILEAKRNCFDMERLQQEVVDTATAFAAREGLDALLLECTDLSAFAAPIQRAVNIPVYDINTLVTYAASAVMRQDYC